ncbi:MAG TPA: hypothetical protein PKU69_03965 [Bacillota bacterium]|nr:hypothetical protein [Bacillota bacterium]HPJ23499.1 hypothetical protein [Bacillota bacterium]
MEWYEILLVVLTSFIFLFFLQDMIKRSRYAKIVIKITSVIKERFDAHQLHIHHAEDAYQFEFGGYLIKLIDMNPANEVIITNSDRVVINHDIKNWKRSTKPHFVAGMKEFMEYQVPGTDLTKIVLIYPSCHNITKYINESDCHLVEKYQKIDGMYFIKYQDLKEFLNNR